jgi:hypothetical protein
LKIANLEGTTEEIKNFFQDNGLKATDFFEQPESPINTFWLVAPGVCVFLCLAAQSLLALPSTPQKFLYIVNCFFAISSSRTPGQRQLSLLAAFFLPSLHLVQLLLFKYVKAIKK